MGELMENNWSQKDYKVVFIIAYFLGLFGVHQFYLGNKKAGFIRLVLTVSMIGLPASIFLWIKDLIQLMRNKIADSEGNIVRFPGFWESNKAANDYLRKKTGLPVEMDTKEKANKVNEMKERIRQKEDHSPLQPSQEKPDERKKSDDLVDDI
jgi:TM2 domain-containing membrane protein YozV